MIKSVSDNVLEKHNYRAVAEFEEQESVMFTWPGWITAYRDDKVDYDVRPLAADIVKELDEVVDTIFIQALNYDHAEIMKYLKDRNVPTGKVKIIDFHDDVLEVNDYDGMDPSELLVFQVRDMAADVAMDDEGNRAVVGFDQCFYAMSGKTQASRDGAIMAKFAPWHAKEAGIKDVIWTRLCSEGGDRDYNGKGVMLATLKTEWNKRNGYLRKEEVEAEFKRIFNLKKIIWMPDGTYDDDDFCSGPVPGPDNEYTAYRTCAANGHLDEYARFVRPNMILLAEVTEEEAAKSELARLNKERLDAAYEAVKDATDADGNPIEIVRIPVPDHIFVPMDFDNCAKDYNWTAHIWDEYTTMLDGSPAPKMVKQPVNMLPALSYTNFLVTNKKVLAQCYWKPGMPESIKKKDDKAMEILQYCFPDRKICRMDSFALNVVGGGVHCFTHEIPKAKKIEDQTF